VEDNASLQEKISAGVFLQAYKEQHQHYESFDVCNQPLECSMDSSGTSRCLKQQLRIPHPLFQGHS
jgi:hypothetical protein